MKGATPIIILLALCCSSSFAIPILNGIFGGSGGSGGFWGGFTGGLTNPVGGASDLFNLATKGTGHTLKRGPRGSLCGTICGNCSQAKYAELGNSQHISSAAEAKAICTGNRSNFSGPQAHWDNYMEKVGPNCCRA
jgi:hypothetical protein